MPEPEQKRILTLLKALSPLWLVTLIVTLLTQPSQALPDDPAHAKAEILMEMESSPSREHFYNLALCEFQMDKLGQASLWAHRYQLQGGDADALLAKLPGIHARAPEGTEWVSIIPRWIYWQALFAGVWSLILLILAIRIITGKSRRFVIIVCSLITITGLFAGGVGLFLYPEGVDFEPRQELAVVTGEVPLRSEPFDGGGTIRANLMGSLCRINSTRGVWVNLTLPSGNSGWVRKEAVEAIVD